MSINDSYDVRLNNPLERLLKEHAAADNSADNFPTMGGNRFDVYKQMKQKLYEDFYRDVEPGLTADSQQGGEEPAAFTHHDISHVDDVIKKIGQLFGEGSEAKSPAISQLLAYEVFAVLVAALIHDVGNVDGRKGHAGRARKVLRQIANDALSAHEIKLIGDIAQAHGGRRKDGNKDTIDSLKPGGFDAVKIRVQLLAAALRLADELADNPKRASRRQSEKSNFANLFCQRVSPKIDYQSKSLALDFILYDDEITLFGPNDIGADMYFIDYIGERVKKAELERRYCSRYLQNFATYNELRVSISFFKNDEECLDPIHFVLSEIGYPKENEPIIRENVLDSKKIVGEFEALLEQNNG